MDMQPQPLTRHQRRELERQQRKRQGGHQDRGAIVRQVFIWIGVAVGLAGIVVGLVYLSGHAEPTATVELAPVTSQDWIRGPETAKATLIEYSDFQCPACGQYYPIVKELEGAFPDDLRVVYRHFPLTQAHANAQLAAQAAEAAGAQGKFWEMHDQLFEQQREWSSAANARDLFIGYAKTLNLDEAAFATALDSQTIKDRVSEDARSGERAGVDYTPYFFLQGKQLPTPRTFEEFKAAVQQAIGQAEPTNANG